MFMSCRNLLPVTQLYVSIDASTKESLKKIDRPLFRDFWPRFLSSLDALSEKVSILASLTIDTTTSHWNSTVSMHQKYCITPGV